MIGIKKIGSPVYKSKPTAPIHKERAHNKQNQTHNIYVKILCQQKCFIRWS